MDTCQSELGVSIGLRFSKVMRDGPLEQGFCVGNQIQLFQKHMDGCSLKMALLC